MSDQRRSLVWLVDLNRICGWTLSRRSPAKGFAGLRAGPNRLRLLSASWTDEWGIGPAWSSPRRLPSFRSSGRNESGKRLRRIRVRMQSGRPAVSTGGARPVQENSDRCPLAQVWPQSRATGATARASIISRGLATDLWVMSGRALRYFADFTALMAPRMDLKSTPGTGYWELLGVSRE
jgi:hypothetical protein